MPVEALERHLLREASRRLKAGVATSVGAEATVAARAGAIGLPALRPGTEEEEAPGRAPLDSFPVSPGVREAVRDVVRLCDTNGDGWVQADDIAEVGRALALRTSAGRAAPRMGYEDWVSVDDAALHAGRAAGGTAGGSGAGFAQSAFEGAGTASLWRTRREAEHPAAGEVVRRAERRAAARAGPAVVAEAWLVSDSDDSDDEAGVGWRGEEAGTAPPPSPLGSGRGGVTLPPVVPRLATERLVGPGSAPGTGRAAAPHPREAPAAGVTSGADTSTRLSERQAGRRRRAFEPCDGTGRFEDPVRTARGITTVSARGPTPGSGVLPLGAAVSRHGAVPGGKSAGVRGDAHHGFARKAHRARGQQRATRSRLARALLSPRFRADDPDTFDALSARGARLAPTRLGAKAAELAEPTEGVVVPPSDAPAFARSTFVSSARAAMESG